MMRASSERRSGGVLSVCLQAEPATSAATAARICRRAIWFWESPQYTVFALRASYTGDSSITTVNAVEFQGVSKSYAIYDSPGDRLKELLSLNRLKRHKDFWALHDVSFEVRRGETFCIVGENGSGKSTLLQMVAGILNPTSGTAQINGRVSAL